MINGLVAPPLREDLLQEAIVYLWHAEEEDPGRDETWYLHGCRLHLQNVMRLGRSLNSFKRSWAQVLNREGTVDGVHFPTQAEPTESFLDDYIVDDFIARLVESLTPQEMETLLCLMDGWSARETAKRLTVSHTMVNRHRSRIAMMASKLGIAPSRNRAPSQS